MSARHAAPGGPGAEAPTRSPLIARGGLDPYVSTMGRSYVPMTEPGGEPDSAVLGAREALVTAIADRLIPGDAHWPPAGRTSPARHLDRVLARVPELRAGVLALLDAVETEALAAGADGFAALPDPERDAVLRRVEAAPAHSGAFRAVYELVCEAYYRHPLVTRVTAERTGFDTSVPLRGVELEPFDERLLDRVRSLPPHYRRVEA